MGNTKLTGFVAWVAWCFLHLLYIVGFKSQVGTLVSWFFSFLSGARPSARPRTSSWWAASPWSSSAPGASGKLVVGEDVAEERAQED